MSQALEGAHRTILVEWIRDDIEHKGEAKRGDYIVTDAEWAELLAEATRVFVVTDFEEAEGK
jgi:hypothetical protein